MNTAFIKNYLMMGVLVGMTASSVVTATDAGSGVSGEVSAKAKALCTAASAGDVKACEKLLRGGLFTRAVDVNVRDKDGRTPLHYAAENGHIAVIRMFSERHAILNVKDRDGRTPLHGAAGAGQIEAVRVLLSLGASVNVEDGRGNTAFMLAMDGGYVGVASLLRTNGAEERTCGIM